MSNAQEELSAKNKPLEEELANYQSFLLQISKEGFNQGIWQEALFHGVPVKDDRYDNSKDVVNGQLVSFNDVEGEEEEGERSVEEVFNLV